MTTQKTVSPSPPDHASDMTPLREQVEERAYYRYLERGRADGRALDDWLIAEAEIRQDRKSLSAS